MFNILQDLADKTFWRFYFDRTIWAQNINNVIHLSSSNSTNIDDKKFKIEKIFC